MSRRRPRSIRTRLTVHRNSPLSVLCLIILLTFVMLQVQVLADVPESDEADVHVSDEAIDHILEEAIVQPLTEGRAGEGSDPVTDVQRLIDQAPEHSIITLPEGTYAGPIHIDKPLQLRAAPGAKVTITNESDQSAVSVGADGVIVKEIHIHDSRPKSAPSVLVTGDRVKLLGLHIVTGSDGIRLEGSDHSEIRESIVEWGAGEHISFAARGNGIDLFQSHDVEITGNVVRGVFDGIYLEFSDRSLVLNNLVEKSRYGIHCMYTNGTIIRHNTGSMNITGGMIMGVRHVEMTDNTFTKQNENVHSQGILLFDAHESIVSNNLVEGNRVGFYVEYSTDNELTNNAVKNNFIGIQFIDSMNNKITGNYFTGNVTDALARDNSDNDIQGNYWDSFSGIDLDGDGRSDTAYVMNPFFQGLVQKKPAFQLFFHTPGIGFLEKLFDTGHESWTRDTAPLMAPPALWTGDGISEENQSFATGIMSIALLVSALIMIIYFRRRRI